jgi:hypothetical protein
VVKVHLDAVVATFMFEKVEPTTQMTHQPLQIGRRWRSAAQMKLLDPLLCTEVTTDEVNFLLQMLKVLLDTVVFASDIARGTGRRLEAGRQLHVQGQWTALLAADAQCTKQIERANTVMKFLRVGMTVRVKHALIAPGDLAWVVK